MSDFEAPENDPRAAEVASPGFAELAVRDRPEIQELFERALAADLPRPRELKSWEPQRLNERHLSMVMMRAGGMQQRQIARAFEVTDSNVSIILNHPDAEYLLTRLQAMRATRPSAIEERLQALSEPAVGALEALFDDNNEHLGRAFKRAPMAFKVLDMNGYSRPKAVEHKHQHSLSGASSSQIADLAQALRESREIEAQHTVEAETPAELNSLMETRDEVLEADIVPEGEASSAWPGGESAVSPLRGLLPSGSVDAPPINDPQATEELRPSLLESNS